MKAALDPAQNVINPLVSN